MPNTVIITAQEVIQAHPARDIIDATGAKIGTDAGTKYRITGTVNGTGPYTVDIWTEVYTQTQAPGYTGDSWATIVANALVVAADPPSQNLGGGDLTSQTVTV